MQAGSSTGSTNPIQGFGDYLKSLGKELGDAIMTNFDGARIIKTMEEMEGYATKTAHQFGQGRENVVAMQAAMGDAAIKVKEMGGSMADIGGIMNDVASSLGRNVIAQGKTIEEIYEVTKVTGKGTGELVKGFKDAGFSISHINKEMQNVVDVARSQGVSALAVSDKVLTNMSALNKFGFENGVQGMAKMAAQATALRIDMGTTLKLAEDLWSPEKAIDLAASLQRLGVAQSDLLDPLRLMDLAQNDPAELQNQISEMSKQFVQLNEKGQFEIMPGARRQLKEVALSLGMTYDELAKLALGSSELEDKMSKIKFPDFADEEQQKLIANLAEMDASTGEYKVTFEDKEGKTVTKSIAELNDDDIKRLGEASQPKTLEDLSKEQLTTAQQIKGILESIKDRSGTALAGTRVVEQGKRATVETYGVVSKTASGEKLQIDTLRDSLGSGLSTLLESINKGEALGGFTTALTNTSTYIQGAFDEALKNGKTAIDDLTKSTNPLTQLFTGMVEKGATYVGEKEKLIPPKTTEVKDFVIPFEQDQLRIYNNAIVGGTNLGNNTNTPSSETTQKISVDGNITVNVTSQGIDTNSLSMALNDLTVKQQIVQAVITGMNPNSNPNQLNQQIKSGEINSYNFG
jgi:hypothetical protein